MTGVYDQLATLEQRIAAVEVEQSKLADHIIALLGAIRELGAELTAIRGRANPPPHTKGPPP